MGSVPLEFTEWQRIHLRNAISVLPNDQRSPFQKWARLVKLVNGEIQGMNQSIINNIRDCKKMNILTVRSDTSSAAGITSNETSDKMAPPVLDPIALTPDEAVFGESLKRKQPAILTPIIEKSTDTISSENFDEMEPPKLLPFTETISSENCDEMEPPILQPMTSSSYNETSLSGVSQQIATTMSVQEASKGVKQDVKLPTSTLARKPSTHSTNRTIIKRMAKTRVAVPNTSLPHSHIPKGKKVESNTSSSNVEPPKRRLISQLRTRTTSVASKLPSTGRTKQEAAESSSSKSTTLNSTKDQRRPNITESKEKREKAKVQSKVNSKSTVNGAGLLHVPKESFSKIHTGVPFSRTVKEHKAEIIKPSSKRIEPLIRRPILQNQSKGTSTSVCTKRNNLRQAEQSSSSSIPSTVSTARPRPNVTAKVTSSSKSTTNATIRRLGTSRATEKSTETKKILVPASRARPIPKGQKLE